MDFAARKHTMPDTALDTLVGLLQLRGTAQESQRAYTFLRDGGADPVGVTYGELHRRAQAIGATLQALGATGERALLLYQPGLAYIEAFFGCLYAGVTVVPVYPPRHNRNLLRLQAIARDAQASLALCTAATQAALAREHGGAQGLQGLQWVATDAPAVGPPCAWKEPEISAQTLACLQYTSGSTGLPKGVMLTHDNLLHNLHLITTATGALQHPADAAQAVGRVVSWLPPYHDMGLIGSILQPLYVGTEAILMSPTSFLQRPVRWLQAVSDYKASVSPAPNFAYDLCVRSVTAEQRSGLDLSSWAVALSGAEPVRQETLERFIDAFGPCGFRREAFYPSYGLAEATLMVTGGSRESAYVMRSLSKAALEQNRATDAQGDEQRQHLVGCGRELPGQQVLVVDPERRLRCAPGVVGEIWVSGRSVARGYWNKPEESNAAFEALLADGEGQAEPVRFLRTGDLGFLSDEGDLFVTGRLKDLIIVRGRNLYPQDIEATVEQSHAAIRPGCIAAFEVEAADGAAVVVVAEVERHLKDAPEAVVAAIRQAVAEEHEVQVRSVVLLRAASIPKTSSGKIQRHACKQAFLAGGLQVVAASTLDATPAVAPESDALIPAPAELLALPPAERAVLLQAAVQALAGRTLQLAPDAIDPQAPLTALGLDSRCAVEIANSVESSFGVPVSLAELLQGLSVAALTTQVLEGLEQEAAVSVPAAEPEEAATYPLSQGQQALWFLHNLAPESGAYNVFGAARIRSAVEVAALSQALQRLTDRYPLLRARFGAHAGTPVQQSGAAPPVRLVHEQATGWSQAQIDARLQQEAFAPFALDTDPPMRALLLTVNERESYLVLAMHHLVTDFWSMATLVRELGELYAAEQQGRSADLSAPAMGYAHVVYWQQEMLAGAEGERHWRYWQAKLAGELPVLSLPTDYQRPPVQTYEGDTAHSLLPSALVARLQEVARQHGATLHMLLLAAFELLLHRWSGQDELLVGSPMTGRSRAALDGVVGYLVNPLPLRARFGAAQSFADFLAQVRQTVLEAIAHQEYPFALLVNRLQPERDASRPPLFQAMFTHQQAHRIDGQRLAPFALGMPGGQMQLGGLALESVELTQRFVQFDLALMTGETDDGLIVLCHYNTALFAAATAQRFLGHFRMLLEGVVADPHQPLAAIPILTPAERQQLVDLWNDTDKPYPPERVAYQLFEEQVERTPAQTALIFEDHHWSYRILNERANRLAHHLRRLGVGPEVLVGLCLERSPEMVMAILAVVKAGGAYLPLDPDYPADRLAYMIQDARIPVLITQRRLRHLLPAYDGATLCLDTDWGRVAAESAANLPCVVTGKSLAYVIYTSGSTGRPKGVQIEHGSLYNLTMTMVEIFGLGVETRKLQFGNFSSDVSVMECFTALARGATLIMAPSEVMRDTDALVALLARERVTFANFTSPSLVAQFPLDAAPALQMLATGAEPFPAPIAAQWRRRVPYLNIYGPTEVTVLATIWEAPERFDETRPLPIGRPVANYRAYILDAQMQPVPVGVPGELYIGGAGVGRGYLNQPELTAERFVPDPYSALPGARLYRTGDLSQWLLDGNIDFLGRVDQQVKIRGFRVETGEIEVALASHPAVEDAVVLAREDQRGVKRLVAYLTAAPGQRPNVAELRTYLAERLPDYMIPARFMVLDAFPLTPNGKVDKRALPVPEEGALVSADYMAPRTPVEELLVAIWAEVLGSKRLSIDENFFEAGGHSLLATQVMSRLRKALQVDLPLRHLFEAPTVAALAERVESEMRAEQGPSAPPLVPTARAGELPLSFAQQRLWFLDQLRPGDSAYHIPAAIRLRGSVDVGALERSLSEIIRRHESLRTTFAMIDGRPVQVIQPSCAFQLALLQVDASAIESLAREEASRPFDLSRDLMLRATLLKIAAEEHVLLFTMHHIASDGWSMGVLIREVAALYQAYATGEEPALAELPIQYADFALWQRDWLQGEVLERQRDHWKAELAALPVLELPTDRPRPAVLSTNGATEPIALSADLTQALNRLSLQEGATLYMTLLAAFHILLHRYSGQDDIAVGTPIANRNRAETEGLIGFFVNTLVMRGDLSGDPTFTELLVRVRERALGAYMHQDLPFEALVDALQVERRLDRHPLFQAFFALQNAPVGVLSLPDLTLEPLQSHNGTAKFDLNLSLSEGPNGLSGSVEYNTDLFTAATIARLCDHFAALLQGIVAAPSMRISELPLLSAAERQQLALFCETAAPYPREVTLHQLFEQQVERTPAAVALSYRQEEISYRTLNERANQLAHYLRRCGVGPEVHVALLTERSPETIIGILAILKAGGSYLPLDPAYPQERLTFMLCDAGAPLLLTQERLVARAAAVAEGAAAPAIFRLDADWAALSGEPTTNPAPGATAEHPAYLLYTSGSTGRPKGVTMAHRPLVNLITWQTQQSAMGLGSRTLQFSSLSFDASFHEILSTLAAGGVLILIDELQRQDLAALPQLLAEMRIERLFLPFVALQQVAEVCSNRDLYPVALREIITAGEQLQITPALVEMMRRLPACALTNAYGPTETHVVTAHTLTGDPAHWPVLPPIGRPIANTQIYILDRHLQPVPVGVKGELYAGGDALARGYRGRPDVTAERFLPDPFSPTPGARLYRTGDLARYLPDGTIEFFGRSDDQVKIRGYRVEPGEIEAALAQHPAIKQAVVAVREEQPGQKRLVAYLLLANPAQQAAWADIERTLRADLKRQLPDYMIPAALMLLDQFPLTPSGKVDRRALPAPEMNRERSETEYMAPHTPVQEVLAGIWAEVLGHAQVGIHDNFFELGGHSLLATQVISRLRKALAIDLPLRHLFEAPTVAALAERVEAEMRAEQGPSAPPLVPTVREGELPLSFAQQRLWFLDQLRPGDSAYHMPAAIRLRGPVDVGALERSLSEIIKRHESLRTTFNMVDGRAVQAVQPSFAFHLALLQADATAIEALAREEASRPFDLRHDLMLRATLLKIAAEEHVLLLTMHHIAADGWSIGILIGEVSALYQAYATGEEPALAELPIQYADFARWQRDWLQGEVLERQLDHWKAELAALPVLELPTDRPRPAVMSTNGAAEPIVLSVDLTQALIRLSQREGATLYMTLLAAFQILLHRYSGQDDIAVGTPIANRNWAETEGLIGFFVNTLVMRADLTDNPTFMQLLAQVRERALGAYLHQDLPFEMLVDALQPERSLSHTPLFQVMFALQNAPLGAIALPGLTLEPLSSHNGTAKFDLTLTMNEGPAGLSGTFEYNTDLFDAATIKRMSEHFKQILAAVVVAPGQAIARVEMLPEAEREQLLVEWNDTAVPYPRDLCVHELFEVQAERTPDVVAVVYEDEQLTYAALNRRANQLAHYLRRMGVGPEVVVGLFVERSLAMMIGLMGILKAGGAYLPLDPAYPEERLRYTLADAKVPVVLTQAALQQRLAGYEAEVLCLDADWEKIGSERSENLQVGATAENLAYVSYTSGSTGRPKGVLIDHRSVQNLAAGLDQAVYVHHPGPQRVSMNAPLVFDGSVSQWQMLMRGHALCIIPAEVRHDSQAFVAYIRRHRITVLDCTPSHLRTLLDAGLLTEGQYTPALALVGGEAIDDTLWRMLASARTTEFYNVYGPTECTVDTTVCRIGMSGDRPTIGRAIANKTIYLLDRFMNPVPVGVSGELYIGGEGLARGYVKRPDLTAERFVPNPFSEKAGERLYRTGDSVRWLPDGNIEFLGRIDHQVKIRGYRIELGEIEATLVQYPGVVEAVVAVRVDAAEHQLLVAYLVADDDVAEGELRRYMAKRLPAYMIPSHFVRLERIPLTPNGKIDRKALPAPEMNRERAETEYVAPRTPAEEALKAIWSALLGVEQIGIYDNFFQLGGDSILSIQVVARARQVGLSITPRQLFEQPTIAGLAAIAGSMVAVEVPQGLLTGAVPLLPIQRAFWEQGHPEPHHFNQALLLQTAEPLDTILLQQAFEALLVHHDALRLRYQITDSSIDQVHSPMSDPQPNILQVFDLTAVPEEEQPNAITAQATALQRSLNLTAGPLLRVAYFNLGAGRPARLLLVIHHLVVDGVSWRILLEDLQQAYAQLSAGERVALPAKTTSYQRWAERLALHANAEVVAQEADYWLAAERQQVAPLPIDTAGGANRVASTQTITHMLSAEETRTLLQEVPVAYRTQINDVLLTALLLSAEAWTNERRVLVALEGHGREEIFADTDLSRTVGWFTTIYPVLLALPGVNELGQALMAVKEQLRAVPNRGLCYGLLRHLRDDAAMAAALQAMPAAEISFNYLGQFDQALGEGRWLTLAPESAGQMISPEMQREYLVDMSGAISQGRLWMSWSYSSDLHTHETINRWAERYMQALRSLINHCQRVDAWGYTPSDFPLARLDARSIGAVIRQLESHTAGAIGRNIEEIYPLTGVQRLMLQQTLLAPESGVYVVQSSYALQGAIDVPSLERSWQQAIEQYAILRTAFVWEGLSEPLQVVLRKVQFAIVQLDWRERDAAEQRAQIEALAAAERYRRFDLTAAPLLRIQLIQLGEQEYRLIFTQHHLLMDGWSMPLLLKSVLTRYAALSKGEEPQREMGQPFNTYMAWLQRQDRAAAARYWQERLQGLRAPTPLPVQRAQANEEGFGEADLSVPEELVGRLQALSRQEGITLNSMVQGAWALLLSAHSGQQAVVYGTVVSGRPPELAGVESIVGLLINMLPMRVTVSDTPLLPWLRAIQEQQMLMRQYDYVPLDAVERWSGLAPEQPLFASMLVFENYPVDAALKEGAGRLRIADVQSHELYHYPLTMWLMPGVQLLVKIRYRRCLFVTEQVEQLLGELQQVLAAMVDGPERLVSSLL